MAILVPVGWWIGSVTARICGYVVAGFFPPGPPVDRVAAAEEILLNQPPFNTPRFRLVIKVRDFLEPYALYTFWVASWLAAGWAGKLAGRSWLGEYGETMPLEWMWTVRLAALAGALIVLIAGGLIPDIIINMITYWLSPPESKPD